MWLRVCKAFSPVLCSHNLGSGTANFQCYSLDFPTAYYPAAIQTSCLTKNFDAAIQTTANYVATMQTSQYCKITMTKF